MNQDRNRRPARYRPWACAAALLLVLHLTVAAQPVTTLTQFMPLGKNHLAGVVNQTNGVPFLWQPGLVDVDGDGDLDLVAGESLTRAPAVVVFFNTGHHRFAYPVNLFQKKQPGTEYVGAWAAGDVDGDKDADLVVSLRTLFIPGGGILRLLLNDGTGAFQDAPAGWMPGVANEAHLLELRDLDRDTDLDLVAVSFDQRTSSGKVHLFLNAGNGRFTDVTATHFPATVKQPGAVAIADVDGDQDMDVVVSDFRQKQMERLFLNDGHGSFTDATTGRMPVSGGFETDASLAFLDVEGDGDMDLVVGRLYASPEDRLYLNDGNGRFIDGTQHRLPSPGEYTWSIVAADVDGDRDPDLLVDQGSGLRLFQNVGNGRFLDRGPRIAVHHRSFCTGDLDRTGLVDLVVMDNEQGHLFLNDGTGTFRDATVCPRLPPRPDRTTAIVITDVNGDRAPDLVLGTGGIANEERNRLLLNDGRGSFSDVTGKNLPVLLDATHALVSLDVDGDGHPDLVAGNAGLNRCLLNRGDGVFTDAPARLPGDRDLTLALVAGDVNGDGHPDLVAGNDGRDRLYLNDGKGWFTPASGTFPSLCSPTRALVLLDVDGDHDLDIALGGPGRNRLHLNDGKGRFTDVTPSRMPSHLDETTALAAGDVDGDGHPDLVVGNSGPDRLYLNDGKGAFAPAPGPWPRDTDVTTGVVLVDVDLDGDLDMVFATGYQTTHRIYLNLGGGRFEDATAERMAGMPDSSLALATEDLDRDGDPDLVAGNIGPDRIHMNLHRQIHLHGVARINTTLPVTVIARPRYSGLSIQPVHLFAGLTPLTPPVLVAPYGRLGLHPQDLVQFPPVVIGSPGGEVTVMVPIPAAPSLVGHRLFLQALVLHIPSRPDLWRLTGVLEEVMVR